MKNSFVISVLMHAVLILALVQDYGIKNKQNEPVYVVDLVNLPPDIEISKDITSSFKIEKAEAHIKEIETKKIPGVEKPFSKEYRQPIKTRDKEFSGIEDFSPEQYMNEIKRKLNPPEEGYTFSNVSRSENLQSQQVSNSNTKKISLASKIFPLSSSENSPGLSVGFSETKLPAGNIIPLEYLENIKRMIQRKWKLPEEKNYSLNANILFRLKKDGTIADIVIEKSSGVKTFDESAIRAIKEIEKFQPLPATYHLDYLDVVVKFNMRGLE